jgi:hypothetical protein
MTRRYNVEIALPARQDIREIQDGLIEYVSPEIADRWEVGFIKALEQLTITPHFPVQQIETDYFGRPIRRYVYRMTPNSSKGYFIYYELEEFMVPSPEPATDYFAGVVTIIGVRLTSRPSMSLEEIKDRLQEL